MGEVNDSEIGPDPDDLIQILVASDVHLGFSEKDAIRGEDSFIAFEEILQLAVENDVDFILLGGDLFHEATPSQNTLNKCLKLLRRYTLGDKPIKLEFLSDQTVNFIDSLNQTVNYEDPNLNVSIPVFSIHGNHDDPSGFGRLSSLDILSTTGLINYFGKWVDLTKIDLVPIMLKKGEAQVALYGLSHIHDARLARLFHDCKVVMERPDPKTGAWFNIMVLHQNRADRGPKNYVPEDILPEFLDLVIWGHEHDCRIYPEENYKKNFFVIQPGSSVATSLSEGEAIDKHCGILTVYKKQFKMTPIRLKTVRPFVFDTVMLAEYVDEYKFDEGDVSNKVQEIAREKIEEMITKAEEKRSGHEKQPLLPLIRLRILYSEEEQLFNAIRFGQVFNERVANPQDIVLFKRVNRKAKPGEKDFDKNAMDDAWVHETVSHESTVEQVVDRYFDEVEDSKKLQLMSTKVLSEMIWRLVERNDINAADNIIKFYKEKLNEFLMENFPSEDNMQTELEKFRDKSSEFYDAILKMLDDRSYQKISDTITIDADNEIVGSSTTAARSRRGAKTVNENTRGTRSRGRGRGRGRGAVKKSDAHDSLSSFMNTTTSQSSSRQRKKTEICYEISDSD